MHSDAVGPRGQISNVGAQRHAGADGAGRPEGYPGAQHRAHRLQVRPGRGRQETHAQSQDRDGARQGYERPGGGTGAAQGRHSAHLEKSVRHQHARTGSREDVQVHRRVQQGDPGAVYIADGEQRKQGGRRTPGAEELGLQSTREGFLHRENRRVSHEVLLP